MKVFLLLGITAVSSVAGRPGDGKYINPVNSLVVKGLDHVLSEEGPGSQGIKFPTDCGAWPNKPHKLTQT